MKNTIFSVLLFGLISVPALAEGLLVEQRAEVVVSVELETGEMVEERRPADLVRPGETVIYTVHYNNTLDDAAENIVLQMQVPDEMVFVAGSAEHAGVTTLYSFDGETYAMWEELMAAGGDEAESVSSAEVRAIKWVFTEPVQANTEDEISFRAVLS